MGYQIIPEREEDKFAIFSSYSDRFVMRDVDEKQVLEFFQSIAVEMSDLNTRAVLKRISDSDKPYGQFTLSLEDAEEMDSKNS